MTTKLKRKLLASQLTQKINEQKEEQLRLAVSNFFRKQMNLVLAAFDEYYNDTMLLQGHINLILAPVHEMTREYYEMLLEHNTGMFRRGEAQAERLVENARQQYSMKAAKPVQFLHDNENKYTQHFGTLQFSEDHLTNYTFTASDKTMNRVDSEINKILTDGYREGWGVRDVRNRIMERYDQFSSWEANRIARTEMQTAHNMGMMNKYQEMGVDYIEWRSAHDKRVRGNRKSDRANHIIMDGEIVKVGDRFSNGLLYPGDKSGKIEEWINCRCSAVPYLMSPGTSAPVGQSQFREENLVSVSEPDYNELLREHTQGALDWKQYRQILQGKTLEQIGVGAMAEGIHVEGLEDIDTFKETIKTTNRKLYNRCKKHNCFDEVYNILKESEVTEFNLTNVEIRDIYRDFKREELKEWIGYTDLDLYNECYDKSFKKFCEIFNLKEDSEIRQAVVAGIAESGYTLSYTVGNDNLILLIDF